MVTPLTSILPGAGQCRRRIETSRRMASRRGRRDDVLIATKVGYDKGLAPERIAEAAEASLRRLGTDYVDL